MQILVINPGSTSTKIALYADEAPEWTVSIQHDSAQLAGFTHVNQQLQMRRDLVLETLAEKGVEASCLDAVAARGGLLPPIQTGAYIVNDAMVDYLMHTPIEHASNLAAPIGYQIAQPLGIPVYIYDGITVDELLPLARVTGLKGIERESRGHNLNCRAAFLEYAKGQSKDYREVAAMVVHLGGGFTVAVIQGGRIVDVTPDDEGPFSPERTGGLPYMHVLKLAFDSGKSKADLLRWLRTQGGFMSYFGTTDSREVERRALAGDQEALFIYEAMALNVGKHIAKLSVTVCGEVEAVILTGGLANSKLLTDLIARRVDFLAPIVVIPGENEMRALAQGALRVLRGEEEARVFSV